MQKHLDIDKIARGLRAVRRGKVRNGSGHFGAMQLAAELKARFQVPSTGGRATDPNWRTKRLLPLKDETLERLQTLANAIEQERHVKVEPMQVAAVLLERSLLNVSQEELETIANSSPKR